MIEVNLLPAELRRVERTPLPRFLVIIIGTALVMTTGAFGVVVNMRNLPDLEDKEWDLVHSIKTASDEAAVHDDLLYEIAETKDRKKAIAEMWRTRIILSKKLVELSAITPKWIGLKTVILTESKGKPKKGEPENGGSFGIECISAGPDLNRVANYRRKLLGVYPIEDARDPDVGKLFVSSFLGMLPCATKTVYPSGYEEKEAIEFTLLMMLKPASTRLEESNELAELRMKESGSSTGRSDSATKSRTDRTVKSRQPGTTVRKTSGQKKKDSGESGWWDAVRNAR